MRKLGLLVVALVGCGKVTSHSGDVDAARIDAREVADAPPPPDTGPLPDAALPADAVPGTPDAAPLPDSPPGTPDARPKPDAFVAKPDANVGSFSISADSSSGTLVAGSGSSISVKITVARVAPFTGAVTVSPYKLQTGVSGTVTIASGSTTGTLKLSASSSADQGSFDGSLSAAASIGGYDWPYTLLVQGPSGTLDKSFNRPNGTVNLGFNQPMPIAIASDGGILVAPYSYPNITVYKLLADGTGVDTSFTASIANIYQQPQIMRVQADGKILVGTNSNQIYRFNADGSRDTAINSNQGYINSTSTISDIRFQSSGGIIVFSSNGGSTYYLQRFSPNGSLDPTFGTSGLSSGSFPNTQYMFSMNIESDNKILIGAWSYDGSAYHPAIWRFTAAGALDTGYGSSGAAFVDTGTTTINQASSMHLASDASGVTLAADVNLSYPCYCEETLLGRLPPPVRPIRATAKAATSSCSSTRRRTSRPPRTSCSILRATRS